MALSSASVGGVTSASLASMRETVKGSPVRLCVYIFWGWRGGRSERARERESERARERESERERERERLCVCVCVCVCDGGKCVTSVTSLHGHDDTGLACTFMCVCGGGGGGSGDGVGSGVSTEPILSRNELVENSPAHLCCCVCVCLVWM